MTSAGSAPEWSIKDAQAARQHAEAEQGAFRRVMTPIYARALGVKTRLAAALLGRTAYDDHLSKVAHHMNRNRDAFSHYDPRHGDVVVSAYFKAGTNWIMHVCHQICHLGAAEFDHIQDVIPWPDAAQPRFWVHVRDESVRDTPTGLRVIKSHLPATRIPIHKSPKYIAVTRDPKDCAASAYHFFQALVFGATMPPPDVWLAHFRSENPNFGRWDDFTASWYSLCEQENVLFLCFEDVKHNHRWAIQKIAKFLDVDLSQEQLARVVDATSIEAMKAINHKFYPARQSRFTDPNGRIIRKGGIGDAKGLFSPNELAAFDAHWSEGLIALNSAFPYGSRYSNSPK